MKKQKVLGTRKATQQSVKSILNYTVLRRNKGENTNLKAKVNTKPKLGLTRFVNKGINALFFRSFRHIQIYSPSLTTSDRTDYRVKYLTNHTL